jgi:hypothetical protein
MFGYDQRGKNGDELGCSDLISIRFGGFSLEIHCHSALLHFRPQSLLPIPLSTTFVHILRLNALLSIPNLLVAVTLVASILKAQEIVDYCLGDHKQ